MLSPKKRTNNIQLPSNVTTTTPCFHNKVWQVSKQVWKKVKWGEDRKLELNWAGIILLWCPSHLLKWQQLWCVMIVTFFDLSAHVWLSFSYGLYGVCGPKRRGGKNQPKKPFPNDFVLADFFLDTIRCVLFNVCVCLCV